MKGAGRAHMDNQGLAVDICNVIRKEKLIFYEFDFHNSDACLPNNFLTTFGQTATSASKIISIDKLPAISNSLDDIDIVCDDLLTKKIVGFDWCEEPGEFIENKDEQIELIFSKERLLFNARLEEIDLHKEYNLKADFNYHEYLAVLSLSALVKARISFEEAYAEIDYLNYVCIDACEYLLIAIDAIQKAETIIAIDTSGGHGEAYSAACEMNDQDTKLLAIKLSRKGNDARYKIPRELAKQAVLVADRMWGEENCLLDHAKMRKYLIEEYSPNLDEDRPFAKAIRGPLLKALLSLCEEKYPDRIRGIKK